MGYDPVSYYRAKMIRDAEEKLTASLKEIHKTACLSPLGPVVWMPDPHQPDGKLGDVYWRKTGIAL